MQFNRFIFDNYLATEEGKKALAFFKDFENVFCQKKSEEYFDFLNHISLLPVSKEYSDAELSDILSLIKDADDEEIEEDENLDAMSVDEIFAEAKKILSEELGDDKSTLRQDVAFITDYSILFYTAGQKYFFPYYFQTQFPKLENICKEFNVVLPSLPSKRNYKERFLYYIEICKAFYDFRRQYELTPEEFCVFLYYFSPHCIEQTLFTSDFPDPTKAYLCVASNADSEDIKLFDEKTITRWGGNTNMLPGDIVLMYEVKPVAAIQTIWRCLSVGFTDPFEYFVDRVWIGELIRIPPITLKDLRENEIWKDSGIVKASMQGSSGSPRTKDEYDAFLKMLEAKGFDTSVLPRIAYTGLPNDVELNVEKDVEEKLLEPLLKKLDYTEKNWVRQLPVRMGRGERNYPDYALFPKGTKGEETAQFLWEAKFTISNKRQLQDAFLQAKSYAMRLQSKGFGLVAKEGIWISFEKDSFMFDKIKSYSWADLENPDVFSEVKLSLKK